MSDTSASRTQDVGGHLEQRIDVGTGVDRLIEVGIESGGSATWAWQPQWDDTTTSGTSTSGYLDVDPARLEDAMAMAETMPTGFDTSQRHIVGLWPGGGQVDEHTPPLAGLGA